MMPDHADHPLLITNGACLIGMAADQPLVAWAGAIGSLLYGLGYLIAALTRLLAHLADRPRPDGSGPAAAPASTPAPRRRAPRTPSHRPLPDLRPFPRDEACAA